MNHTGHYGLSEQQKARIRELAAQGLPYSAIAQRMGISKSRVGQIAKRTTDDKMTPILWLDWPRKRIGDDLLDGEGMQRE